MTNFRTTLLLAFLGTTTACDIAGTDSLGDDGSGGTASGGTASGGTASGGTASGGIGTGGASTGGDATGDAGSASVGGGGTVAIGGAAGSSSDPAGGNAGEPGGLTVLPDEELPTSYAGVDFDVTPGEMLHYRFPATPLAAGDSAHLSLLYGCGPAEDPPQIALRTCADEVEGCIAINLEPDGASATFIDDRGRARTLSGDLEVTIYGRTLEAYSTEGQPDQGRAGGTFTLDDDDGLGDLEITGTFAVWINETHVLCP